ncbi:MAG: response regulator [Thermodesulfobacteriota bacterium]|jgi:DNA-binding NtrC family response regulator
MLGLLIADDDAGSRMRLAEMLREEGYDVATTHSAALAIEGVLKDLARVVILGGSVDGLSVTQLLPVLKKCKADLKVIIASEEPPLEVVRRLRREGIFYYLVKPLGSEDGDEVRQVVQCAFEQAKEQHHAPCGG